VTIPAGTTKSVPLVTPITFPSRIVTSVAWRVPPGPSGLMGWALTSDGTPVIPVQPGAYMVTDNQADTWYLEGYLDSGNWQVTGYNTGIYPHTVYLTFQLDLPGTVETTPPPSAVVGADVVGATGTVTTPAAPPAAGGSSTPAPDDSPAVITAVLSAMLEQLQAAAAG